MCLFGGMTVTVLRREPDGMDAHGNHTHGEWHREEVAGVLPEPVSTADLGAERPEGERVDMRFHFPKGYGKSLEGCSVSYAGRTYRVVGDPQPYVEELTPGPWNLTVEAEAVDG